MANMKEIFAALWGVILISQVYGQNKTGNLCYVVTTRNVTKPVMEQVQDFLYLKRQNCNDKRKDDVQFRSYTQDDGMTFCDFFRPTLVPELRNKTFLVNETTYDCCEGYGGYNCTEALCDTRCKHGGMCAEPNKCNCSGTGYEGNFCETARCNPPCGNGGNCSEQKICICEKGWEGTDCKKPTCEEKCQNNGNCTGPNQCTCPENWTGRDCSQPKFECGQCLNGGSCMITGKCSCTEGYEGEDCSVAICKQQCLNGAICVAPNSCLCPAGYHENDCGKEMEKHFHHPTVTKTNMRYLDSGGIEGEMSKAAACKSWNSNQYTTFDGRNYVFPGKCIYDLASHIHELFQIRVDNAFECDGTLCKRSVIIEAAQSIVVLFPNGTATHNDRFFNMPKTLSGQITVKKLGRYTVVIPGGDDVKVFFDNDMMVLVKVSESLKEHMTGLCGNFDGEISNELIKLDGTLATNFHDFGNEMAVPYDSKCMVPLATGNPCQLTDDATLMEIQRRCDLLDNEEFFDCGAVVDVQPFKIRCREDACRAGAGNVIRSTCMSFTTYSRMCSYHGVVLSWRKEDHCHISCSGGQIYSECGSSNVMTCKNYGSEEGDPSNVCIDRCVCPSDTVWDTLTKTCVQKEMCSCSYGNKTTYHSGNIMHQDCNKCTCESGKWNCTKHECARTCKVIGEDHHRTFDGKEYQFSSDCEHVLVQTESMEHAKIVIWIENKGCGFYDHVPCQKTVSMQLYDEDTIIRLKGGNKVMVGLNNVELPYKEKNGKYKIFKFSSTFMKVETRDGLDFRWDQGHRIYIKLEPYYKAKVRGLCGNYNYKQVDDFVLPNGDTTTDVAEFGNLWGKDRKCCIANKIMKDGCSKSTSYRHQAEKECTVLKSEEFALCNHIVSPTHHISMCESDICRSLFKNVEINDAKCTVLSDYSRSCTSLTGKATSDAWRNSTGCPVLCDGGRIFDGCMSSCEMTCKMLGGHEEACANEDPTCTEGCVCPEGKVFDESLNKCVEISLCPCYHRNVKFEAGRKRQSLCDDCTCNNGQWSCALIPGCTKDNVCSEGKVWVNCTQCERSCDNQQVQCEQTECYEGCSCDEGTVDHSNTCIKPAQCPCSHAGVSYKPGDRIKKSCNLCTCQNSTWQCTNRKCPSTCSAVGDPHYTTFDGRIFQFHGDCTYTLVEDFCGKGVGTFRILVENVPCSTGGLTCTKSVKIVFYGSVIRFIRGREPIEAANPMALAGTPFADYHLARFGFYYLFKTKVGLSVMWDRGTRVYVKLAPNFMGRVCGLCGNYDGDAANDFKTRQGDQQELASNFGDSWKSYYNCPNSDEDPVHPCTHNPHRVDWAKQSCSIIREGVFRKCHGYVDPEPYYASCVWDACGCDRGGDCECLCTAVAAYARECTESGKPVVWRSPDFCGVQCDKGTTYNVSGSTKSEMCFPDKMDESVSFACVEGCHCPPGNILHKGKCIKETSCPCMVAGVEMPHGSTMYAQCQLCKCISGQLECASTNVTCPGTAINATTTTTTKATTTTTTTTTPVISTSQHISTTPSATTISSTTTVCYYDKEYSSCANRCQPKCHYNRDSQDQCSDPVDNCIPGCVCPGKKVMNENGTCVEPLDCDCKDNDGNRRKNAESWQQQCDTCMCFNNEMECTNRECQPFTCASGLELKTKTGYCCPTCMLTTPRPTFPTIASTGETVTESLSTTQHSTTVSYTASTVPTCNKENGEIYESCKCVPECGKKMNETCVNHGDEYGKCCVCEEGKVKDETGKCVAKKDCICTDEEGNSTYPGIPTYRDPCLRCNCIDGLLNCSAYCRIDSCTQNNKTLSYDDDGCCFCTERNVSFTTTSIPSTQSTATASEIATTVLSCYCEEGTFGCNDCAECVSDSGKCDGRTDCTDGSDENDCPCSYNNVTLKSEDKFPKSKCEDCECKNGNVTCTKKCNVECMSGYYQQEYDDDRCCECIKATTALPTETTSTVISSTEKASTSAPLRPTITSTEKTSTIQSQPPAETTTTSKAIITTEITTTTKAELTTKAGSTPHLVSTTTEKTVKSTIPMETEKSTTGKTTPPTTTKVETTTTEVRSSSPVTKTVPESTTATGEVEHTTVTTLPTTESRETTIKVTEETTTSVTMTTRPKKKCREKMGLDFENPLRSGINISTSSTKANSKPEFGRLNFVDHNRNPNAWRALTAYESYFQITFKEPVNITAILLQGDGMESYISLFRVKYKTDNSYRWYDVLNEDGFQANFDVPNDAKDAEKVVQVDLPTGIVLTSIRLLPISYHGKEMALRTELLGCYEEVTTTTVKTTTTTGEVLTTEKGLSTTPATTTVPTGTKQPGTEVETTTTKQTFPTTVSVHTTVTKLSGGTTTTAQETAKPNVTEVVQSTPSPPTAVTTTKSIVVPTETTKSVPTTASTGTTSKQTTKEIVTTTVTTAETSTTKTKGICEHDRRMERYLLTVKASSEMEGYWANKSSFNGEPSKSSPDDGGWSPSDGNSTNQYLEFDFNGSVVITTVLTRNAFAQKNIMYKMKYHNGSDFVPVLEARHEMVTPLNDDNGDAFLNHLDIPITTTRVRVLPHGPVQLKVAFYGCLPEEVATTPVVSVTSKEITTTSSTPVTEKPSEYTTTSPPTEKSTTAPSVVPTIGETTTGKPSPTKPTTTETIAVETTTERILSTSLQTTSSTPNVPTSSVTKVVTSTTKQISTVATKETPTTERCDDRLGMEVNTSSKTDFYITSSYEYFHNFIHGERSPDNARLNNIYSWTPMTDNDYLAVGFVDHPVTITSILMQGYKEEYVSEFEIEYQVVDQDSKTVLDESGRHKIYKGNDDGVNIKEIKLSPSLKDIAGISIHPRTWNKKAAIRMELKGCFVQEETTTATQTSKTIVTTKTVPPTTSESTTSKLSTTPEVIVTTTKTMPITSEVVVTSSPKFSTKATSGTSRTTEKVTMSQRPTTTAIVSTMAASESTPVSLPTVKPTTESTPIVQTTTEMTKVTYSTPVICDEEMGMRYYKIPDDNIKASSSQDGSKPEYARNLMLNDTSDSGPTSSAWYPNQTDAGPYLDVEFPEAVEVTYIFTQGDRTAYVPKISVGYKKSTGEEHFKLVRDPSTDMVKDFRANSDGSQLAGIKMPKPIIARVFRIYLEGKSPDDVYALRVEFRVCVKEVTVPVVTTTTTETVTIRITQKPPESTASTTGELTTSKQTEKPTVSESIHTTTTVTEKTTPVTPRTTPPTKQPSETTTVVTTTRNLTETTSAEITETVSQSTVKTTEKPITSTETTTGMPEGTTTKASLPTATSETTGPTILLSTTVIETKPITTTKRIATESSGTPEATTLTGAITQSSGKPEVTTTVTMTTRKPEIVSTTEETVGTMTPSPRPQSTIYTRPVSTTTSTASTGQISTTERPKTEVVASTSEKTKHAETATTGMKESEKPSTSPMQTPVKTTSIVQTTTTKMETVESTTISHCDNDMGMKEVNIPDSGITASSNDSKRQYIKASNEDGKWVASPSDKKPYVRIELPKNISLAKIEHTIPSANYTVEYQNERGMVPIRTDSDDDRSPIRTFHGIGTTILDKPIDTKVIKLHLIRTVGSPTTIKIRLFSCKEVIVPGTSTTTTETVITTVVPTTPSETTSKSTATTPQTPTTTAISISGETSTSVVSKSLPTIVTETQTVTKKTIPASTHLTSAPSSHVIITTTTVKSTTGNITETTSTKEVEKTSTVPISTSPQPTQSTVTIPTESTSSPKVTPEIVVTTSKLVTTSEVATTSSPGTVTQTEKTHTTATTVRPKLCNELMQWTEVSTPEISASSNRENAKYASIDSETVWSPTSNDTDPHVEVTYEKSVYVTELITQGNGINSFVTKLEVFLYDENGTLVNNKPYSFNTSFDSNNVSENKFRPAVLAKKIKIVPVESEGQKSLRFAIKGCFSIAPPSSTPKTTQYSSTTTAVPTSTISSTLVPTTEATGTSTTQESTHVPSTGKTSVSTRIVATSEGHITEETTVVAETKVTTVKPPTGKPTPVVVESTTETTVARTTPISGKTSPVESTTAVSVVTKETTVTTPITHATSATGPVPTTTKYVVTTVTQMTKSKSTETPYTTTPTVSKEVTTTTRQETVETTETPVKTESSSPVVEVTTTRKSTPITTETMKTTEIPGTGMTTGTPVVISSTRILQTTQPTVPESATTVFVSKATGSTLATTLAHSETSTAKTEIVSSSKPSESTMTSSLATPVRLSTTVTTSNITKVTTTTGPCSQLLRMTNHMSNVESVSASSEKSGKEAKFSIISYSDYTGIPPAWSPKDNDEKPYLTVTFKEPVTIHSILTQGGGNGEYARNYTVGYIDANSNSTEYVFLPETPSEASSKIKIFAANTDDKKVFENELDNGIDVTAVRIYPIRNLPDTNITMRVDFRGCVKTVGTPTPVIVQTSKVVETTTSTPIATETQPGKTTVSTSVTEITMKETTTTVPVAETSTGKSTAATSSSYRETSTTKAVATTTTITKGPTTENPICDEEMKKSLNLTVSSTYQASSNNDSAENGRLNETDPHNSWVADESDKNPFLEMDYNDTIIVTSVRVRGSVNETGGEEYVTTFVIQYMDEATGDWVSVEDDDGNERIFEANENGTTVHTTDLEIPIRTKKVRVSPKAWHSAASLCVDIIGCYYSVYEQKITMTSKSTVATTETPITETLSELATTTTEAPAETTSAVLVTSTIKVYPTTKETAKPGTTTTKPTKTPETTAITTTTVSVKSTEQPTGTTAQGEIVKQKTSNTPASTSTTTAGPATELATHTEMLTSFSQATTKSPQPVVSTTVSPRPTEATRPTTGSTTTQQTSSKSTMIYPTKTTVIVVTSEETKAMMTTAKALGTTSLITSMPICQNCSDTGACGDGKMMKRWQNDAKDCCTCTFVSETSTTQFTVTTTFSPTTKRSCENKTCPYLTTKCGADGSKCADACDCPVGTVYNDTECVILSKCPCYNNSITYKPEEVWNSTDDNCTTCVCVSGRTVCHKRQCTALYCGTNREKVTLKGECCPRCISIPPPTTSTSKPSATSTPSTEITTTTTTTACQPVCDCMYGCDRDDSECQMLPNECPYICTCQETRKKLNGRCAYIVPSSQCPLPGTTPSPPIITSGNETTTALSPTATPPLPQCPSKCDCDLDCNGSHNCTVMLDCSIIDCECANRNAERKNGLCGHYPPECMGTTTTAVIKSTTSARATAASTTGVTPIATTTPVCPPGKVVKACPCRKSCEDMADPNFHCPTIMDDCQPGCDCPTEMVEHGDKCINETECPCYFDAIFYKFGDVIPNFLVCKKCTCLADDISCQPDCNLTKADCEGEIDHSGDCCKCQPVTGTTTTPILNATSVVMATTGIAHTTSKGLEGTTTATKHTPSTPLITAPEITCITPLMPMPCGCNKTCSNTTCDPNDCLPGCYCPSGYVMAGQKCIREKDCPCVKDGLTYPTGGRWNQSDCISCNCTDGKANCEKTCNLKCSDGPDYLVRNESSDECCYCRSLPVGTTSLPSPTTAGKTTKETTSTKATTESCIGCVKNGQCYKFGEDVRSNCLHCICMRHLKAFECFESPACILVDCEPGFHLVVKEGECCPSCDHSCPGQFNCGDGQCKPHKWTCDGEPDCANGADEENCSTTTPAPTTNSLTGSPSPGTTTTAKTPISTTTVKTAVTSGTKKTYMTSATTMTKITNLTTTTPATGNKCEPPFELITTCQCSRTCQDVANKIACTMSNCKDGCLCPSGYIEHEDDCILKEKCPCYDQASGKVFVVNATISKLPCETCTCKEDGKHCEKACNVECNENQELVDTGVECCYCKEKTCLHNGTNYEDGKTWHPDNCTICKCDNGEPSCGEDCNNMTCPDNYTLVNPDPDDHICCQCRPPVYCVDEKDRDDIYKAVGQEWRKGRCEICKCIDQDVTECTTETCHDCQPGYQEDKADGECCGVCVVCEFQCSNGTCIKDDQKCDGSQDCPDGSDEHPFFCEISPPLPATTTATETSTAITTTTVCDGFECSGTQCLPSRYVCDGEQHCTDGKDEMDCPTTTAAATTISVTMTTTKPLCSSDCICTAGCDGSTDDCGKMPGCNTNCECPTGGDHLPDRENWRCILPPPLELCPITSTTTAAVSTTTPTAATTLSATTTTPTPYTLCNDACVVNLTCQESRGVQKSAPFETVSACSNCLCPLGSIRDVDKWGTRMCLITPEYCTEQCKDVNTTYKVNETFNEGDCRACKCLYNNGIHQHKCTPFCQLSKSDCLKEGKELFNKSNACCECLPLTTPKPQSTTPGTTALSTSKTGPATTTPLPPCPDMCFCNIMCNGSTPDCTRIDGCSQDKCACPESVQYTVKGRCAVKSEECVSTTTAATGTLETTKSTTSVAPATTTTAICNEGHTIDRHGTCQNCTCEDGKYNCTSYCRSTCKKNEERKQAPNACCYCAPIQTTHAPSTATPQVTTFSVSTTSPMTTSQRATGPPVGGCVPTSDFIQVKSPDYPGCISEEEVELKTCRGTCESHYKLQLKKPYFENECTCCKPETVSLQKIELKCPNGTVTVDWPRATSCSCKSCKYNPFSP